MVGAHGLTGRLRVRLFGDGPDNLQRVERVWLGAAPDDPAAAAHRVVAVAPGRRGEARIELAGVAGREAAEALRGLLVLGDPASLPPPEPGAFYWFQLVGCRVEDPDGRSIGTVRELWDPGAHDVLVVEGEHGAEILIPAVEELLREVDLEAGRIVVEPVPGLLDPAR